MVVDEHTNDIIMHVGNLEMWAMDGRIVVGVHAVLVCDNGLPVLVACFE